MKRVFIYAWVVAAGAVVGCTASTPTSAPPPPVETTPTPVPLGRTNPYVIEETETHTIQRYPKAEYIRVGERHIRHPLLPGAIEFFREDESYYYVTSPKHIPEDDAARRQALGTAEAKAKRPPRTPAKPGPPLSDFADLVPARSARRFRLERVASTGLPADGLWRASFVVADVNEDRILDIVAPPPRVGEAFLHIWIGDGKGGFTRWPLKYSGTGKENSDPSINYGGVAVADFDGDGHADVASASHGAGLATFFGDGKGGFRVVRKGLPLVDYSAQGVVAAETNGDGRPDLIASRDVIPQGDAAKVDMQQVRVYVNRGQEGWEFKPDGLVGGFYSNALHAWDYDGDGRKDILTGSHYNGALTLLWKNEGNGTFSPVSFPEIEIYSYHFATAPGTFGRERAPAYADAYYMYTAEPEVARAAGISVYALRGGTWSRHRVWRKKDGKTLQYGLAMGDLDGDGLDDVVFPDSEESRLRIFLQEGNGGFSELDARDEPVLDGAGQCVRLADLDSDGRLDIVLSKSVSSAQPTGRGGWEIYLNRAK